MSNPLRAAGRSTGQALNRRGFLTASLGAYALGTAGAVFGFTPLPTEAAIDPAFPTGSNPTGSGSGTGIRVSPTLWFAIDGDGTVSVNIIRAEMGQHVGTALARILADELEADWAKVRVVHVDSDPKWGLMVTGGSWSVSQSFQQFSQAGAAGRIALVEAGARLLNVAPSACHAAQGRVVAGTRSVSFGEIVSKGALTRTFTADELKTLPLKPVDQRRLIGRPVKALDIAPKTTGAALYGIDARVPGMVYARPKLPPTRYGCAVTAVDDSAARAVKGYVRSLVLDDASGTVPGWVVVVAESYPAAIKAADLVKVTWTTPAAVKVTEADLQARAQALIADPGAGTLLDTGPHTDTSAALAAAASRVEATYTTSTVLHFQMEPLNALAFEKDGVMEIHTGNQWQSLILPTLSKALNRPEDKIVLRSYLLGGGFGRRLTGDYTVPAALATRMLGRPVKLVFTREDDALFDAPRSPSVQTLRMGFDAQGGVVAMEHHAAAGWPTAANAPALMPKGRNGKPYDPFSISGADHWYEVGAQTVRALSNDLALETFRPGWLRSVGPGWTNWAVESFMDEAAHHLKVDPVALRLRLLTGAGRNAGSAPVAVGGAKRQAAVLRRAAELAGWGRTLPADTGLGIATSFGQERDMPTWVACAAQVRVERKTGRVTVDKLIIVTDAGTVVDPDGARAQTEGGALWGLSMALHEGTAFANGVVKDRNLDTYEPLRIDEAPLVETHFIDSAEAPVGLGEPAVTVVAPAIANAIFAAVGARVRHLPITPDAVKAAIPA